MIAGIDVGSTYLKLVWLNGDGKPDRFHCEPTGLNPDERVAALLDKYPVKRAVATGYGRHLIKSRFHFPVITEIKAHARAVHHVDDTVRVVADLGGQDSKTILLNGDGGFGDFLMNDRCAAGTGKFIEMCASRLDVTLAELDAMAIDASGTISISSMCAVFAESEIVSLLARRVEPTRIARGVMESIGSRLANMARKMGGSGPVMFTGGGARNRSLQSILAAKLGVPVQVPEHPQYMGALGAAVTAADGTAG